MADLVGTQRHYWGAVITLVAAVVTLVGAVLLAAFAGQGAARSGQVRGSCAAAGGGAATRSAGTDMSERMIWDALDEGRDPTNPDNKGR